MLVAGMEKPHVPTPTPDADGRVGGALVDTGSGGESPAQNSVGAVCSSMEYSTTEGSFVDGRIIVTGMACGSRGQGQGVQKPPSYLLPPSKVMRGSANL